MIQMYDSNSNTNHFERMKQVKNQSLDNLTHSINQLKIMINRKSRCFILYWNQSMISSRLLMILVVVSYHFFVVLLFVHQYYLRFLAFAFAVLYPLLTIFLMYYYYSQLLLSNQINEMVRLEWV